MSISKAYSAHLFGLSPETITIEVDISHGLHSFSVVGLGDRSVDESKDRISAAIKNSGFKSPKQKNEKVVISLAPADIRKEGPSFDLAMALCYLQAAGEVTFDPENKLFFGELSLIGEIRKVNGLLPILMQAGQKGFREAFIPAQNAKEASLAQGIKIYPVNSLREVISHLEGTKQKEHLQNTSFSAVSRKFDVDMSHIRGNDRAKRGLEIAASGYHNVIMSGPPGTGKTLLAQSLKTILPELSYEESVEVTGIHSAAKVLGEELITLPPFRAPHHTASYPSIVGGGAFPKPGEITLAHRGILFLDEFPEFDRSVIEALRQPLEDGRITISRAKGVVTFPASCIMIATMNPCPCGKRQNQCSCSPKQIELYSRKLSGPILDRIDLWLDIDEIDYEKMSSKQNANENSRSILKRVRAARELQKNRFHSAGIDKRYNSELTAKDIEDHIFLSDSARKILTASAEKLGLSGRAFHRVIKVGRTIADLAGKPVIEEEHILEALQYRRKY